MTHEEELLYFKMNMLQAEIEMQSMIAENKHYENMENYEIPYKEKDFMGLMDKYGIHHNAFPYYKGE